MSKISVDTITDEAGTGAPDFPNGISATGPFTSLGISTGGPRANLGILDSGGADDDFNLLVTGFRPNIVLEDASSSATDYQLRADSGNLEFRSGDASTNTKLTTERMRINTAGNVGIGTASPTEKLDVAGTVKATSFSGDGSALTGIGVAGYGTQVATTSGTAFDFTGIPAGVNKVTMVCKGVSLNGINLHLIQLGTSGGIVGDGYVGAGGTLVNTGVNEVSTTNGLAMRLLNSARDLNGSAVFTRMSSGGTVWAAQAVFGDANAVYMSGASVDIGGELTQVRLTRSGSNTFDAGAANISWSY